LAIRVPRNEEEEEILQFLGEKGLTEEDIYDYSEVSDDIYGDRLREGLTEHEVEVALRVKRFLRGVMLVTGEPGSGKGLFGHVVAWIIKTYWQGRRALLDHKPRPAFGPYLPFDEDFLHEEFGKLAEMSKFKGELPKEIDPEDKERIKKVSKIAADWIRSERGRLYLQGAVLLLEEFKRYLHNRRPMNPMGITLSHIATWWRHFDILIIGMTPQKQEIDRISFLPYVTHEVRCWWTPDGLAECDVYQTSWVSSLGVLNVVGRPKRIVIDGWLSREELGGLRYFDLYNTKYKPSLEVARIKL